MLKFRKKTIEIEAFQLTVMNHDQQDLWPEWLVAAREKNPIEPGKLSRDHAGNYYIFPLANMAGREHRVDHNDWIIQGVNGEIYTCKPDIFDVTYEPVLD